MQNITNTTLWMQVETSGKCNHLNDYRTFK